MKVDNMTLVKIAALGGVATVTMGLLLRSKINENVKKTEYYKEALKILRSNKTAINLLGEPIKDKAINIGDISKNYTKDGNARYEVPLHGTKEKGKLYFWAEQAHNKWTVKRMELEIGSDGCKRLLIRKI